MNRLLLFVLFLFPVLSYSQHTFSIVAVDVATGEIGSAGATCLGFEDGALAISDIVLGVGAIHTQAWWTTVNQNAARVRMEAGDTPDEIIAWQEANDNSSQGGNINDRQYGVVDLNDGTPLAAAFTGSSNFDVKGHRIGDGYSIQGNILISEEVLDDMETAYLNTDGPLCEKLMAVMQAAKRPGADVRCLDDGISSGSAFIRVAKPTDTNSDYGNLWLDINVWLDSGTFTGDPIDELQIQFDLFKGAVSAKDLIESSIKIFPNPTESFLEIESPNNLIQKVELVNTLGETVLTKDINATNNSISLKGVSSGVYFIRLYQGEDLIRTEKILHTPSTN